ncbi:MAG: acylneuraminate cytidylyltransferase family protein [Anaerolineales bacterium]|nr:acylneuraminate cytidylyltransferase family protein [Anaerolineales bacterium]
MNDPNRLGMVALVPMRHRSVRVSEKNYRPIAGKPLYAYILETLSNIGQLDRIVVDTDSRVIREGVGKAFPHVQLIPRPEHLLGEDVPMNEILLHDASVVESDYYLQTHSTNPLMRPETFQAAIDDFMANLDQNDALFGVTRKQVRIWDAQGQPINHDPFTLEKTQDLPPFFEENSCVYLFKRDALLSTKNRLGSNPRMFEIPELEAFDIDTEWDFKLVETLIQSGRAED